MQGFTSARLICELLVLPPDLFVAGSLQGEALGYQLSGELRGVEILSAGGSDAGSTLTARLAYRLGAELPLWRGVAGCKAG